MEFCVIAPTCLLEEYAARSRWQMCVAAWGLGPAPESITYCNFYKSRVAAGDKVILDNGAYEGQLVPQELYIKMIEDLRPYAYVVPDVIRDPEATAKLERGFPVFAYSHRVFVMHDVEAEIPNLTDWLAAPKWWGKDRVRFIEKLKCRTGRPIHALGFIDDDPLAELPKLAALGVQSIDSSHPVWHELRGAGKFKDFIHQPDWLYSHQCDKNLTQVFQLCGARESSIIMDGPAQPLNHQEREATRPRYDLIPKAFLDELAGIFEEGAKKYGVGSWKGKSPEFFTDCLNHAQDHLARYNDGDHTENQLAKVAWNVLARRWWDLKQQKEKE